MEQAILEKYNEWLSNLKEISQEDYNHLKSINDEKTIIDLFYKDLSFGTGGLRGVMDIGSNRLNSYTIFKATYGLALYLKEHFKEPSVVIGYDSRNHSSEFALLAAKVFVALGVTPYLFKELIPTPIVSYAIRYLHAKSGIIITASHNPREYNGYKVYNELGSQITLNAAEEIYQKIQKVDPFKCYLFCTDKKHEDKIEYIKEEVIQSFIESTLRVSCLKDFSPKEVKIVYTPLNGTGRRPVVETLTRAGFTNIIIPKEQEYPDGNFTTCPYPNPEMREALTLGIQTCKTVNSDLLIATDPDCDRCGIGVKYHDDFILLSGNEVAILLLTFFTEITNCNNKELVRSIVSTSFVDKIAQDHDINVKLVLTGFKFIGEEINRLEQQGKANDYLFGFEESYGYLTNKDVRDKDAVNAALIISEMFYYYKQKNISLIDQLEHIYAQYGYCKNSLLTHTFAGRDGMIQMNNIMNRLRNSSLEELSSIFNSEVIAKEDYLTSKIIQKDKEDKLTLPKSDVIMLHFSNHSRLTIRPSGTEPKLKCYIEIILKDKLETEKKLEFYQNQFHAFIGE